MDWKEEFLLDSTDELGESLRAVIVALEHSVQKLRWEDVVSNSGQYNHSSAKLRPASCVNGPAIGTNGTGSGTNGTEHVVINDKSFKSAKDRQNSLVKCSNSLSEKETNAIDGNYGSKLGNPTNGDIAAPVGEDASKDDCQKEFPGMSSPDGPSDNAMSTPSSPGSGGTPARSPESGTPVHSPGRPRSAGLHKHRHLDAPKTILDVDYRLLQSGVVILPGCRDMDGNAIVFIFTSSTLWKNQQVASVDLARLIMYYYAVPRKTVRCRGLTIVADIRGSSTSTINTLLESLYLFEGNVPHAISVVRLLADKHTQSLVLKSPIYDVRASFQIDLLLSLGLLHAYISASQLPPVLEGSYQYNHDDWMRFHMRLDPFLASCHAVAKYLINIIQELSAVDQVPATVAEASHLVTHHENLIRAVFEDARVKRVQNDGEAILQSLEREQVNIGHSDDFRYNMEDIRKLYHHVQDTITKLLRLSDTRLHRLEKCLHLKQFEEESNKIITWLHAQGNEHLQRHLHIANNLKGVRTQQKDFEKFYYNAMAHIEKGNDLLEEAGMLAQSGEFEETRGYKDLATTLKRHLQQFSERLEQTRERIEGASRCYQLLDKTYEWALEAMKYVASMKMEHCATPEGLEKLIRSLDLYLRDHPPIKDDTFKCMYESASVLKSDKLLEQCQKAHSRCQETQRMLSLRGNTLQQFKEQLEEERAVDCATSKVVVNIKQGANSDLCKYSNVGSGAKKSDSYSGTVTDWEFNQESNLSTEMGSKNSVQNVQTKSRTSPLSSSSSSSLALSSPTHSVLSSFSSSSASSSPYHVPSTSCQSDSTSSSSHQVSSIRPNSQVSQTSDQKSDRNSTASIGGVVGTGVTYRTNIPKTLLDQKHRSSKENLSVKEVRSDRKKSDSTAETYKQNLREACSNILMRSRPAKKLLKRAISSPATAGNVGSIDEEDMNTAGAAIQRVDHLRRQDGRADSMITGSSDSLPSLPEEEDSTVVGGVRSPSDQISIQREWTPIPVNSHLTDHSSTSPVRPLADLKLGETQAKSQRTLALVMAEMVQTERDYVCALRLIVENYIPEMSRDDVPQALRGKRNVIFGNLEKIYQFHQQYFLQEMEASKRNPFLIARYFLMHEQQFHLYTLYNKNKPKSDALMAEYGKQFFRHKQIDLCDRMDLSSYLLKPVQRMAKYALLIRQILKECPTDAPEYVDLKAAEDMTRFQLRHGNDLLAMDSLMECDVNLQEQGRLLRQDEFLVYNGRRKYMRHVFLFEDLILFSKTRRSRTGGQDTYIYKLSFKMSDVGITEDFEGSGYKFEIWWRRRNKGDRYVLQAPSSELKRCWVRDVSRLLWSQAIKNREKRMSELATMGIGNKPCLDIKPSSNNIQDRFINIAVGEKEARFRNSIAVCSRDHLSQRNKRPHSIISVGSTSSSNSSQSGAGFSQSGAGFGSQSMSSFTPHPVVSWGAMNLAFNPMDSPRTYRKSLTFMSNESGLGTSISSGADFDATLRGCEDDVVRARSPPLFTDFSRPSSIHPALDRRFVTPKVISLSSHSEEVSDV